MMDTSTKFNSIPSSELRCVWMEAGILPYQLCNRMADCDNCPLDAAITRRFPGRPAVLGEDHLRLDPPAAALDMPHEGFQYSCNHWWVRRSDRGAIRLGIAADLSQALLPLRAVVLPVLQQHLCRGQACIWVVMHGGTMPLEAPLDGQLRAVNHDLMSNPHLLSQQPFDNGWLCELEVIQLDGGSAGLMNAEEAQAKYAADRARFRASLSGALHGRRSASVTQTLADGSARLQNFADILGPSRYLALVRQSYGWNRR